MISTRVGFSGGTVASPTYQQVCAGGTGHAEVVEVTYDARIQSTWALLTEFFLLHNLTKDRRSGKGQYRSVIFLNPEAAESSGQEEVALRMLTVLRDEGYLPSTELRWETSFFPAGSRHQQYCSSRGIVPKKRRFKEIKEILTLLNRQTFRE